MSNSATTAPAHRSFAALRHPAYRGFFFSFAGAMMADSVEHVISYWVMFEKFHSPALAGFAVLSHWLPFLLFSVYFGAMADRYLEIYGELVGPGGRRAGAARRGPALQAAELSP